MSDSKATQLLAVGVDLLGFSSKNVRYATVNDCPYAGMHNWLGWSDQRFTLTDSADSWWLASDPRRART